MQASGETTNGQICIKNFASVAREEGFDQNCNTF